MQSRPSGALAAAFLLCCAYVSAAQSEPLRILYAEPFQAQSTGAPGAQKSGPANLRVQAFGRTFELELEDNSSLLRATSAQTRQRIGAIQLLKGTVKDAPGSWVRLALNSGRYSGAFWDGSELYAIESSEQLEGQLLAPMPAAATAIYRLSDTQGGLFAGSCGLAAGAATQVSPLAKFRSLIRELQTAAATAPREIEISVVSDFEFTSRLGSSSAVSSMLDRMNVVDGIFSSQVGVATIPTDFITFAAADDPFTASEATALLNQFADYRNSTPVVRSRGLAHLFTGRQLDGNTVGIAFLNSLCRAREGSSLSESSSFFDSALITAHELGHNFGAPHDGEAGSACSTTQQSFLMAPTLNGSATFSPCSVQVMQPRIEAASCVVAARNRDIAVSAADDLQGVINEAFEYVVDVDSIGELDALNAYLTVVVPSQSLAVLSATMAGVACTVFGNVRCELGTLAPGQGRRLTLSLRSQLTGNFVLNSAVTSTADRNPANDSKSTVVHILSARAVGLTISPQPMTVTTGQPFEMSYDVSATGSLPLRDMRIQISNGNLTPLAANVDSGTCTFEPGNVSCALGDIARGAPRHVRVQWVTEIAGPSIAIVQAFESANPVIRDDESFLVQVQAQRDIALAASESFRRVALGQDATYSFEVASLGVSTVNDVHVELLAPAGVTVTMNGPIASNCTTAGQTTNCALGAMPARAARTLQFRAHATAVGSSSIMARVVLATPDNVLSNDSFSFTLDVRLANDVLLSVSPSGPIFDGRLARLFGALSSQGANAAENVRVSVTLPTGFVLQSVTLGQQPCTIDTANPHLASCAVSRMEPGAFAPLDVQFVAPEPGTGTALIEATCDSDADPANDSSSITLEVRPNVDARLTAPPAPQRARTDLPVDLLFTINTGKYAVPDVRLSFSWFASLDEFSASAPGATCGNGPDGYACEWTSIAANTSVDVALRVRSSVRTSVSINAFLESTAESDYTNNFGFVTFAIFTPSDAAVTLTQPALTLTTGQAGTIDGINIVTLSPLDGPFVELKFDQSRLLLINNMGGSCSGTQSPDTLLCSVQDMEQVGTHQLSLRVVPQSAGVVPITIRVGAFNDFNTANDMQVLTVTVTDPPTPPPPPPPPAPPPPSSGGSGGGGGGGSMSWLLAALLLTMWHHRRTQFRVHR